MTDNKSELKILRTNKVKNTSEQVPSDVDTDADYDVYSNGEPPKGKKKNRKSSNTSTNAQKQNSQYKPLEKHKKNRKTLYIICGIFWFLIVVALILFLLYYFNVIDIPGLDMPTDANTKNLPNLPDRIETYEPTVRTSPVPTQAPTTMILRRGNEITDQGITMNFPKDAFPDSWLKITISSASDDIKEIFSDTTAVFKAKNIDDITGNTIHFQVENNPLDIVPGITYKTTIPIPQDLLNITKCPSDYGYEIFTIVYQIEFDKSTYPAFALFPSEYTQRTQTLTTYLHPEMFNNKTADIVLSCTPGTNVVPPSRRLAESDFSGNPHWEQFCKASEIICPIENGQCITLNPFSRSHDAVDYATVLNRRPLNVVAVANGVVERSETSITYGNVIVIRNEDGSATLYGGLQNRRKRVYDKVIQGEIIGLGAVNGHLHFEYIPNGEIYATKARINPNDCFPPPIAPTNEGGNVPTKSPLVYPNTHAPTPSPVLATGSITVRDSGALADDSFAVYIDTYRVCETEIGELNTCPISFLRPGLHTLTLEVLVAPDKFGTFFVALSDGLEFTDGTTSKDAIKDYRTLTPEEGWTGSWNFTVPTKNELSDGI